MLALDIIGASVGIDMNALVSVLRKMDPMSKAQALAALTVGENAVKNAISIGTESHFASGPLLGPGAVNRIATLGEGLSGIRGSVSTLSDGATVPPDIAASIRTNVEKAIVEYNGVAEGDATLASARDQFYADAYDNLKALPSTIAKSITSAIEYVTKPITSNLKIVLWVAAGVVVIAVGGVIYSYRSKR